MRHLHTYQLLPKNLLNDLQIKGKIINIFPARAPTNSMSPFIYQKQFIPGFFMII